MLVNVCKQVSLIVHYLLEFVEPSCLAEIEVNVVANAFFDIIYTNTFRLQYDQVISIIGTWVQHVSHRCHTY